MHLYLVAVLPPEPVLGQVWQLKQEVHRRTGSRNAVRLPPHITLVSPTRQPETFGAEAITVLQDFAATQASFQVSLAGFRWFDDRTLYVHVSEAAALLQFHATLRQWCARHLPTVPPETRPFTPHLTLATRDLPAAQVPALRQDFAARTYHATFPVTSLEIFRHNGHHWHRLETFLLAQPI